MLLTLSSDREFMIKMESLYFSSNIFSAFVELDLLSDFVECETDTVDFAVIDVNAPIKKIRASIDLLRSAFRSIDIVIFGNTTLVPDGARAIRSKNDLISFLSPLIEQNRKTYAIGALKITPESRIAILLGYPMRLTPSEHRILLLLASEPQRIFSPKDVSALAFPFKEALTKNQIAVHVCNINRKAFPISGRPLIQNPHKNGYLLNPHL